MDENELRDILEAYSTKRYSIEYGGFLSNHISHGIIALARLGASKDRIQQFIVWYEARLEKPEENPKEMSLPDTLSLETLDYKSLLGKRSAYFPLLEYYWKLFEEECQGSMESFISKYLPQMVDGICCSALHPLIHTGYGYSVKSPLLVVEGIAYLHHSYICFPLPEKSTFGQGTHDVLDVLEDVRKDRKLCSFDSKDEEQIKSLSPDWNTSKFQKRMAILAYVRSNQLMSYADRIQLPSWFKVDKASLTDVMKLCDWIIDKAVAVYTGSDRRNDFFLLHGVTAAWSLKQLFSAMEQTPLKVFVSCIQEFMYVLVAVYIVQDSPKMIPAYLSEEVAESWEQIIEDTLKSQKDEHVYKLVQVCHERALTYPPNQQHVFKRAALSSLQLEFKF